MKDIFIDGSIAKAFFYFICKILNIDCGSELGDMLYIRIFSFQFFEFEKYLLSMFGFHIYLYEDRVEIFRGESFLLGIFYLSEYRRWLKS